VAGEAVQKKKYDVKFLSKFESIWQKKHKRTFQIGAYINKRLARYSDEQWDQRVKALAQLEPRFIPILLKGNFSTKILLQLAKSNPKLFKGTVVSALKSILKSS
jgi:hypothetical protein